jgi:hypothetical protein
MFLRWNAVQFWGLVCGVIGLGTFAFYNAFYFTWYATGQLTHADLRYAYFLRTGLWFAGFLVCGSGVVWLLRRFCDYKGRFRPMRRKRHE